MAENNNESRIDFVLIGIYVMTITGQITQTIMIITNVAVITNLIELSLMIAAVLTMYLSISHKRMIAVPIILNIATLVLLILFSVFQIISLLKMDVPTTMKKFNLISTISPLAIIGVFVIIYVIKKIIQLEKMSN